MLYHGRLRYNPALDGVRGIAILLVLLSHAHVPLFEGAFFGVDLFFVLSGFLITTLLLIEHDATGRLAFWPFYRRRFFRLMPALALFLLAYCLLAPLIWPELDDIYSDALVSILYLADYGIAFFDSPDTLLHMWSLSVEEHFYLLWPLLLLLALRHTPRGQRWWPIALLWLLGTLWRAYWVLEGQPFYKIFFRFDTRFSGLMAGALLATLMLENPRWLAALRRHLHHALWLPLALPLLLELGWDSEDALLWGITVVELAAIVLVVAAQRGRGLVYDMLSAPALVALGRLSYGVYLWHYPVVRYLRAEFSWPVVVVLGLAISCALAALSYHTVERWALRWRDRRAPASVGHPPGASCAGASTGSVIAPGVPRRASSE